MQRYLIAALLALAVGCAEHEKKPVEPAHLPTQRVRVSAARELTQPLYEEVVGTVRARNVTAISASVMGTVREFKVKLGSRVRAGDVLVRLSAGEVEARAVEARAVFAQAKLELSRAEQLKSGQSIAASQYDAARAQYDVAEAGLSAAETLRGYTQIRAPVAGVVSAKLSEVGELAVPGKPLLVLESPSALRLEASVPEAIAQNLRVGDSVSVRVDTLGRELTGSVAELSPSADPLSRTLLVKVELPATPELRAGMFGRLLVRAGDERVLLVPSSALLKRGQLEVVYVLEHGKAVLRLVRGGRTRGTDTEILAGLDDGEVTVASGAAGLVEGQPLAVLP